MVVAWLATLPTDEAEFLAELLEAFDAVLVDPGPPTPTVALPSPNRSDNAAL